MHASRDIRYKEDPIMPDPRFDGLVMGRRVYYVLPTSQIRHADIGTVWSTEQGIADLFVFITPGDSVLEGRDCPKFVPSAPYSAEKKPATWHFMRPEENVLPSPPPPAVMTAAEEQEVIKA